MLTNQLCGENNPDKKEFALSLENSAVVVAPLIPWSIASAVPLAFIGAPTMSDERVRGNLFVSASGMVFLCQPE